MNLDPEVVEPKEKQTSKENSHLEQMYRQLIENAPLGFLVFQGEKILFANPFMVHLFGANGINEVLAQPLSFWGIWPASLIRLSEGHMVEISIQTPHGQTRHLRCHLLFRDEEARIQVAVSEVGQANDESQREGNGRQEPELQMQASLARRTRQVQTSTEVAQDIAAATALEDLFRQVVNLVQERFGYYHVHVYTLENDKLIMQEGSGEAGRRMKENKHAIPLTHKSLVTRAAKEGMPVLVANVLENPHWLPNELLPDTRSEIAVPIRLGSEVLGVLDVQSNQINGLGEEDQLLLMGLCGQIAVAINNHRLEEKRKISELQLRAYTRELERSNNALQEFAYVASHDLHEPLRKVHAFSDRLRTKYENLLDERGLDYLDRMQSAIIRMQTLINDLLVFSRVMTKSQPFVQVSLQEIAQEVINDLEIRIEQLSGSVELGALPTIEADRTQMRQLLQNLIGNALKFHRPDVQPFVKIESRFVSEEELENLPHLGRNASQFCQILVTDNGIGFDEQYLDRIFVMFQRLHGRGEYEGNGVGLPICRKIVERHGGYITAKSRLNEGSQFIITLPLTQNQDPSRS